jgi:DNA-binding XRE family transcriptional regulator
MLNNLKQIREQAGLNQSKLARLSKVGRQTIIRIENQEVNPHIRELIQICGVLNCQITDLNFRLTEEELMNKKQITETQIEAEKLHIRKRKI